MWHEIRKQEKKIKGMIVDYKRRAERRKDYYLKIKADPTQFLQVHGRQCKIHLDPAIAAAGDSSSVMMNWAGSPDVVIDRFDVRAHLDYVSEHKPSESESQLSYDERYINYERYRILVQNEFLGVAEEKFLHQLCLEEQFGASASAKSGFTPIEGKKKVPGAAIGYNYDDPSQAVGSSTDGPPVEAEADKDSEDEDEDDSDLDFDVCVDVSQVTNQQAHELNKCSHIFGMEGNDYFSFLTKDKEEAENLRLAKELEEEKAMYSGRKSRRERRAYREKKLAGRKISPPSYASRRSPTYQDYKRQLRSHSKSKSPSPENSGQITYITSFGDEEQSEPKKKSVLKDLKPKVPLAKKTGPTSRNSVSSYSHKRTSRSPPHHRSSGDRHRYSPGFSRRSPYKFSRSPNSPLGRQWSSRSPHRTARSPRRLSRSPRRFSRSPRRPSRSPHRLSRSPRRSSRSPRRPSRSPRRLSKSPRRFSRSPHHSSKSPRRPSRSPFNSSKSPHRNSRSPRRSRDTPSPPGVSQHSFSLDGYKSMSSESSSENTANKSPPRTNRVSSSTKREDSRHGSKNQPVPRYYGRRKQSSSSELSWSEGEENSNASSTTSRTNSNKGTADGNSSGKSKPASFGSGKLTQQERLKRKMQLMLNRQFKADKKAEKEKYERVMQERLDRQDEMRELSIKLRKRERMRRHEYYAELERGRRRSRSRSSRSSSRSDHSRRSLSRSPVYRKERSRRSRSRSSRDSEEGPKRGLVDY